MKKLFLSKIFSLVIVVLAFTACKDDEWAGLSVAPETFDVCMFVTNNANEDLVLLSDDYHRKEGSDGFPTETFTFDAWEVYLDGKLVQSGEDNSKYRTKRVSKHYGDYVEQKNISLDTEAQMQRMMKDWGVPHVAEYVLTSASLFGDTEEHVVRMEFLYMSEVRDGVPWFIGIEYSITFDGQKQQVFYPKGWDTLFPRAEIPYINSPYFILNLDSLN